MTERRRKKRFARRLQIRYWVRDDAQERNTYTTNVSMQGAFIATNAPSAPGTRLRIEFLGEGGFVIEAVVTHAARVSASLQSIRASGMGVRFLSSGELISALLPFGSDQDTEPVEVVADGEEHAPAPELPRRAPRQSSGAPVFTVGFRNVGYLLNAIEQEIRFGGVFVHTDSPAGLQQEVRIALALPAPIKRTVYADAIVVSLSDPAKTGDDSSKRGMGVALKDTTKVLGELDKLIEAARPRPG